MFRCLELPPAWQAAQLALKILLPASASPAQAGETDSSSAAPAAANLAAPDWADIETSALRRARVEAVGEKAAAELARANKAQQRACMGKNLTSNWNWQALIV